MINVYELGVKQTEIGARNLFVRLDIFIRTRYMNHSGNAKARINVTIDSTVKICSIVGINRP